MLWSEFIFCLSYLIQLITNYNSLRSVLNILLGFPVTSSEPMFSLFYLILTFYTFLTLNDVFFNLLCSSSFPFLIFGLYLFLCLHSCLESLSFIIFSSLNIHTFLLSCYLLPFYIFLSFLSIPSFPFFIIYAFR